MFCLESNGFVYGVIDTIPVQCFPYDPLMNENFNQHLWILKFFICYCRLLYHISILWSDLDCAPTSKESSHSFKLSPFVDCLSNWWCFVTSDSYCFTYVSYHPPCLLGVFSKDMKDCDFSNIVFVDIYDHISWPIYTKKTGNYNFFGTVYDQRIWHGCWSTLILSFEICSLVRTQSVHATDHSYTHFSAAILWKIPGY